jgi:hypothetical protein
MPTGAFFWMPDTTSCPAVAPACVLPWSPCCAGQTRSSLFRATAAEAGLLGSVMPGPFPVALAITGDKGPDCTAEVRVAVLGAGVAGAVKKAAGCRVVAIGADTAGFTGWGAGPPFTCAGPGLGCDVDGLDLVTEPGGLSELRRREVELRPPGLLRAITGGFQ